MRIHSVKRIILLSFLVLSLSTQVFAQGKIPRTKRPSTRTPSKRSSSPQKPEIKSKDRLAARDLFAYLRFNRFDKAEQLIRKHKKQKRLEDVRIAYFELWPSPKVLGQIAKRIQSQKPSRRKILEPWAWVPKITRPKNTKPPVKTPKKGKLF